MDQHRVVRPLRSSSPTSDIRRRISMSEQAQTLAVLHNRPAPRGGQFTLRKEPGDCDFPAILLAMAGHDLRQPLQIITSAHDILATALGDSEQREELARAAGATSMLATMLGQIVDALQLHELARDCQTEPVSLGPILEDLAREFWWLARSKDISLNVALSPAAVYSHPVLLRGMLRNLLCNAI